MESAPRTDLQRPRRAGFVAPSDESAQRIQQLALFTAQLAATETLSAIIEAVVSHVADTIQAAVATLMTLEGEQLVMIGAHGLQPGVWEQFGLFGLWDENPASQAVREGKPIILRAQDDIEYRYPVLAGRMPPGRSLVCLPLHAGGQALGVIGLTFEDNWSPGPRELDLLTTFADSCAQAIRRVRATEEAQENAKQLAFLADASLELSGSLDYRQTLANVAQLTVPTLADWCAVAMLQEEVLVTLAVAHVDPEKVAWAWTLQDRYPPDMNSPTGASNVVRTGVSELYPEITDEMLVAAARDDEHLRLSRELDLRSALIVPLLARNRTLGAITLLRTRNSRKFTSAEVAIAEDLGRRAAVAIDNAVLHGQAQNVALQLQRAVLPGDLTNLPDWEIATYYEPGGYAEVGGDFYDAIPLANGKLAIFIGDVMGHGIEAAAAMAQMRAAIRAYLSVDPTPAAVVSRLDQMFEQLDIKQLVTLTYGVLDPHSSELRTVNAGHYPPLLVESTGTTCFAESTPQRPLGAGGDDRAESIWQVRPSTTVLFYTDGLVERRDEIIDDGLERLSRWAPVLSHGPLQTNITTLINRLSGSSHDDVTALAVRIASSRFQTASELEAKQKSFLRSSNGVSF